MTFTILTFGCKVNAYESAFMKEELTKAGYEEKDDYKKSDIVIINTCSVTNTADNKCKKMIRSVRRENKNSLLVVCGCMAENQRNALDVLDIDVLIGNKDKSKIVSLIENYKKTKKRYVKFYEGRTSCFEDMYVKEFSDLTRAYVKIQDGCNNYCSYCIIPYVRGNIRSKKLNLVLEEVKELVSNGHKEIVLTGINTGAYGKETGTYNLVTLLREISKIDGLERIRLSSIEITEITDDFIEELKRNTKLCGHLHISLQSGSETVLKRMNRKYTKEEYRKKVEKLKEARPNINLTTDVIVGFPGETEEEFLECIDFCKQIGFSKIHVFPYSKRDHTKAAEMDDQLDNAVKKERARRLIAIDNELQLSYHKKFIGKTLEVLIEEVKDGYSIGHTENFLKVEIDGICKLNQIICVTITACFPTYVKGKICK